MNTLDTVSFGLLYPALLRVVPKTGVQWLNYAIGNAVADVAMRTHALRWHITMDAQAGVSDYPIDLPEGYTIVQVEQVCVNGVEFDGTRMSSCATGTSPSPCVPMALRPCAGAADMQVFSVEDEGTAIRIVPAPPMDAVDAIRVEVSLLPSRTACELPRLLYERYGTAITDLALTQVMTDPTMKVPPRTFALIERRAEAALRAAQRDVSMARVDSERRIASALGGFLV
jgi:hypothetical protein